MPFKEFIRPTRFKIVGSIIIFIGYFIGLYGMRKAMLEDSIISSPEFLELLNPFSMQNLLNALILLVIGYFVLCLKEYRYKR